MRSRRNARGVATWIKVLIGFCAFGVVGGIALLVIGGTFLMNLGRDMCDPQHVQKVANSIAKIEYPLPSNFKPMVAIDMMGVRTVSFSDTDEHLTIMLMQLEHGKEVSAEYLIQTYSKKGVANPGGPRTAYSMQIQSTGHLPVAGLSMPYAIGESAQSGMNLFQLVGCVVPKQHGRPIMIIGQSFQTNEYKMDLTKQFLAHIKEF